MNSLFADYFLWLNAQLAAWVGTKTAAVAGAIEPAAIALMVLYIMFWGYECMTKPTGTDLVMSGAIKIIVVSVVMLVALRLALYNTIIADTFYNGPDQLAARIIGSTGSAGTLDRIWSDANAVAERFLTKASLFSGAGFYIAAAAVWILVGATVVYAAFLIILSKIAITVLLAVGPLFLVLVLFKATRDFCSQWFSQLANYGFVTIIAIMFCSLMLGSLQKFADDAMARGDTITISAAISMCIFSVLLLLVLRQTTSIAAGLASGIALSSFGAVSRGIGSALGGTAGIGNQFIRGTLDKYRGRHDSISRLAGQTLSGRTRRQRQALPAPPATNSITPRSSGSESPYRPAPGNLGAVQENPKYPDKTSISKS